MRRAVLVLSLLTASACRDRSDQAAADSAELARDLALVNQAPANPQFQDTALSASPAPDAVRPAPRTRTPTPTRRPSPPVAQRPRPVERDPAPAESPAPQPRFRGFVSGTTFALATNSAVCTTNLPGDKLTATLIAGATGENGAYLPPGTTVVLEVASVTPGDTPDNAQIALRVRSIFINDNPVTPEADVAVMSPLERREVPRDKNSDRRKVVTGAIAGAVLGQIMGRDTKSTVIGAAAGAAAGTAVAAAGRKYDACLPSGGTVRVTTSQPITLTD